MPTAVTTNALIGKKKPPAEAELKTALGPASQVWQQFLAELAQKYGVRTEWKSYSAKWGWSLRVMRGKRTIVWLSPREDCFEVLFILGTKAMTALEQCQLPKRFVKVLSEAPRYPEGTGVRLRVKAPREISLLKKLVATKVAN